MYTGMSVNVIIRMRASFVIIKYENIIEKKNYRYTHLRTQKPESHDYYNLPNQPFARIETKKKKTRNTLKKLVIYGIANFPNN